MREVTLSCHAATFESPERRWDSRRCPSDGWRRRGLSSLATTDADADGTIPPEDWRRRSVSRKVGDVAPGAGDGEGEGESLSRRAPTE